MSALMDTLLDDTRRQECAAERRDDGPIKSVLRIVEPATRADRIIAAGNAARVRFRSTHYTADSAMVYGAQVGHLHGEVRVLCNELDAMSNPTAAPAGEKGKHIDVRANADLGGALVRCFYDRDGDLMAVFLRGVDLTLALSADAMKALEQAMRDEAAIYAEANAIDAAITRSQA